MAPDPYILEAIRKIEARRKTSFPWRRDEPHPQPYFTYSSERGTWLASTNITFSRPEVSPSADPILISWNIDFMLPLTSERMSAALAHLQSLLLPSSSIDQPPTRPAVIFLMEMLVSDLQILQSTPWMQQHFHLTDLDDSYWESGYYGTCTLIDKRLAIKDVFRVHYSATRMERDALFVDVKLDDESSIVRFCNTHLESLIADPPVRPTQMAIAAKYMHEGGVHASVLAGDLNAIQPFDRTLHSDNGLCDAFLELGGREDADEGYTWGQQARTREREMFGCSRMDKVYYCGDISVSKLERIGVDVEVVKDEDKQLLKDQGLEKGWVTDHLGLMADLVIKPNQAQRTAPHL